MYLKKYSASAKNVLMTNAAYSTRALSTLFLNTILLVASFFLWTSLYGDQTEIRGYTLATMYTYYAVTFVVSKLTSGSAIGTIMGRDVRAGSYSFKLLKPYSPSVFISIQYYVAKTMELIVPICILLGLIYFFPDVISRPANPSLFLISFLLGVLLNTYLYLIIGSVCFWIINNSGITLSMSRLGMFMSGAIIPLNFFPQWLVILGMFLPYRYTHFVPVSIYLGTFSLRQSLIEIMLQIIWVIILFIGYKIVFKKGIKNYGAVGN